MVAKKETENTSKNWLDEHNIDEILETEKLDIKDEFSIPENDFTTVRKIKICSMPYIKKGIKTKTHGIIDAYFVDIKENGIDKVLWYESKVLQRSFIATAIKLCNAKTKSELDLSVMLGKMVNIRRISFTDKFGKNNQALQISPIN